MSEEYPYQKKWERYRLYVRLWMIMFPLLFVPFVLLENDISFIPQKTLAYSIPLLWIVFIIVSLGVTSWKCPRCRRFYFALRSRINIASDFRCRNCGLEKYEGSDIKSFNKKFGKRFG
ncbi:MAG TPA: hypothetical protein VGB68_14205 [Pyrinomonadaceae bacterium]